MLCEEWTYPSALALVFLSLSGTVWEGGGRRGVIEGGWENRVVLMALEGMRLGMRLKLAEVQILVFVDEQSLSDDG